MIHSTETQKGTTAMPKTALPKSVTIAGAVFTDPKIIANYGKALAGGAYFMRYATVVHTSGYDTVAFTYAEVILPALNHYSPDFMLITERDSELVNDTVNLWKLQGEWLGSQEGNC